VRELFGLGARVLGVRALAVAEDLVARLEVGHLGADRLDASGAVPAPYGILGFTDPQGDAGHIRPARHEVPNLGADAGRAYLDQHLVVPGDGAVDVSQSQKVR
jgi:hypothetical protein